MFSYWLINEPTNSWDHCYHTKQASSKHSELDPVHERLHGAEHRLRECVSATGNMQRDVTEHQMPLRRSTCAPEQQTTRGFRLRQVPRRTPSCIHQNRSAKHSRHKLSSNQSIVKFPTVLNFELDLIHLNEYYTHITLQNKFHNPSVSWERLNDQSDFVTLHSYPLHTQILYLAFSWHTTGLIKRCYRWFILSFVKYKQIIVINVTHWFDTLNATFHITWTLSHCLSFLSNITSKETTDEYWRLWFCWVLC